MCRGFMNYYDHVKDSGNCNVMITLFLGEDFEMEGDEGGRVKWVKVWTGI